MDSLVSNRIESLQDIIKCQITACIDDEYIDRIFSGVMTLDDFADYVFFEIASEYYMIHAKKLSLNQHVNNIFDDYLAYLETLEDAGCQSKKLKSTVDFSDRSLYRLIHEYLVDMLDRRTGDLKDPKSTPSFMRDLMSYDASLPNKQRDGYPLTTAHFLQVYTSYALNNKQAKYVLRLSDKNLQPDKAASIYQRHDTFLEFSSCLQYRTNLSVEECDRYISNAINLKTHEQRYFRNTLYTYASRTAARKEKPTFLCGNIPPVFLGFIRLSEAIGHCIAEGFLPEYYLNQLLVTGYVNDRKPYMFLSRYAEAFSSSDAKQRLDEECRYYAIQILASNIIHLLRSHRILAGLSPQEFAAFIHHRYNAVVEMLQQAEIHETIGFSKSIVSTMRALIKDIDKHYGFIP